MRNNERIYYFEGKQGFFTNIQARKILCQSCACDICSKNKSGAKRYGITTGKKVGKAVSRTRARRVIRTAYRELYPKIREGYDFVFVARAKTPAVKSYVITRAMKNHLSQAGALDLEK